MNIIYPSLVFYQKWIDVPEVVAEATVIAMSIKDHSRTIIDVFDDSMNGLTLQYAVADELRESNYNVTLAPDNDKTYDFKVDEIKVDVKGMFNQSATSFKQSSWEFTHASKDTIYVCYDCRGDVGEYKGWCGHGDFKVSKFDGLYIYPKSLNK